jgi:hypothetical protein
MTAWNYFVAHWAVISAGILLFLKWVYNAWTPNVTFPQFVRNFIGEVVQEAPSNLGTLPPAEKQAVMAVRVQEAEHGKPTS